MNFFKFILFVAVTVSALSAQTYNIRGKVTDTGVTPLSGAIIKLESAGLSATSAADGSFTLTNMGINGTPLRQGLSGMSAWIRNGYLTLTLPSRLPVTVETYSIQGKLISRLLKTIDAGTQSFALPQTGRGVFLHKIKAGQAEFVIKGSAIGQSSGDAAAMHSGPVTRQAHGKGVINDVICGTKDGYLNYFRAITNSDTTGLEIKMIANAGTVKDTGGNEYQTVRIGTQIWAVDNLRATKYNDGTPIPKIESLSEWAATTTAGFAYYDYTSNADSIKKFGAYYNGYAVATGKLAPKGWRIPDTGDFWVLRNFLVANGYNWDGTTTDNKFAKSLASKTDWVAVGPAGSPGVDLPTNNRTGFSGYPAGFIMNNGLSMFMGQFVFWWSSSAYGTEALFARSLDARGALFGVANYNNTNGFPVRFMKDAK